MDFLNQLPFMQQFNKAMPKAAPANPFPHIALPGGVPGASATKTVLNAPRGTRFGVRGLAGGLNAAALGGQLLEEGLAGMDNEYGRKVAGARDQRELGMDQITDMGMGGMIQSAFGGNRQLGVQSRGLPADYKATEQQARNEALMHRGRQNRAAQIKAGGISGQLPSDYKQTEAEAFRGALEAGDPQTESIRAMTGTDTSTGNRESLRTASEDERYAAWAAANPELAKKAYAKGSKQAGYSSIEKALGLSNNNISNYDANETFKPSDLAEADRQDPTAGRTGLKDMQSRGKVGYDSVETFKPSDIPEADRQNPLQGRSGLQDMQTGLQSGIQGMLPKEDYSVNNLTELINPNNMGFKKATLEYDNTSFAPELNQAISTSMNTKVVTPDKIMASADPQAALQTFMKTRGLKR